jgi:hypothetical protein
MDSPGRRITVDVVCAGDLGAVVAWWPLVVLGVDVALGAPVDVSLELDCAQAGAATSIVVTSRGAAHLASIDFIAGFSVVDGVGRDVGARHPNLAPDCGRSARIAWNCRSTIR